MSTTYTNGPSSLLQVTIPTGVACSQTSDQGVLIHQNQLDSITLTHTGKRAEVGREGIQSLDLPPSQSGSMNLAPYESAILELPGTGRGTYWPAMSAAGDDGRSRNIEAMPIVQVPWAHPGPPVLRPPVLGSDPLTQFLRATPILESDVDVSVLPSVITLPAGFPSLDYWRDKFERYSGDHYSSWSTDTRTPDQQHPGYGSYLLGIVSEAMTILCSTIPQVDKQLLATRMCQWGLDLAGAFASGRENYKVDGGHMQGRSILMILAGKLLNIPQMMDPRPLFGPDMLEMNQYYAQTNAWWFGGMDYGWIKHWQDTPFLQNHPSTWTSYESWSLGGYFEHVVGAQVGSMMALKLMGLEDSLGEPCRKVVEFFMDGGPPTINNNELIAVGVDIPWGDSYGPGSGISNLAADAWNQVF